MKKEIVIHKKILDDIEARHLTLKVKDFLIASIKKDCDARGDIEEGLVALNHICNMYYNENNNEGDNLDDCFKILGHLILRIHPALIRWLNPIRKYVENRKACDEYEDDYKDLINNVIFFSIGALEHRENNE